MDKFRSKTLHLIASLVLVSSTLLFSHQSVAASLGQQEDKAPGMVGDILFARPLGFVGTVLGTAVFVYTLPLSLLGGNVVEAANSLVVAPVKFTFFRPLGG